MEKIEDAPIAVEPVTITEVLGIASWDRPLAETDERIHSLLERRLQAVGTIALSELLAA